MRGFPQNDSVSFWCH